MSGKELIEKIRKAIEADKDRRIWKDESCIAGIGISFYSFFPFHYGTYPER